MGDFNVDLLKVSDNNAAGDFYNMFSSYFLTPFVLQPSRLKAKTLIDNIFFNSLEYSSFSWTCYMSFRTILPNFWYVKGGMTGGSQKPQNRPNFRQKTQNRPKIGKNRKTALKIDENRQKIMFSH